VDRDDDHGGYIFLNPPFTSLFIFYMEKNKNQGIGPYHYSFLSFCFRLNKYPVSARRYVSFSIRMSHTILSYALLLLGINIINSEQLSSTRTGAIGAIYTMTDALRNQVIVNCLTEDGELKVVRYVDTKGIGINSTDYDPFFTQSRLVVYSNYLFVINPGSNSLSMFLINPYDPTELTLLSVQPVFGSFPVSVTVNFMYACVLTGGHITGIRCFTYNSNGLRVVPSFDRNLTSYISQTEPPTGPLNTMSEITFSADDRALIIAVKGGFTQVP
jgi:hypothetical protein